jgi:uncharacterized protein YjiS (DUF1127 family)
MAALAQRVLTNYHPKVSARPSPLAVLAARLRQWHRLSSERRALARLSDYELKDFGATRGDVERELSVPFWKYPSF